MKQIMHAECAQSSSMPIEEIMDQAMSGDAHAQFMAGEAFRTGEDARQSDTHALYWYLQAAKQDHPDGQNNAGSMLLNGMGTEKDSVEAVAWYRKAAEQDHPDAQFNLALRYLHGDGIELDPESAAAWLFRSVEHGHVEAIGQLGTLFRFGRGVGQDFVSAAELHVIAAMEGDVTSMGNLQDYQHDIEEAALAGSVSAAWSLAKMYDNGIVVSKDKAQVYAWLRWALQRGTKDNEDDTMIELSEWLNFVSMTMPDEAKQQAEALLKQMEISAKMPAA